MDKLKAQIDTMQILLRYHNTDQFTNLSLWPDTELDRACNMCRDLYGAVETVRAAELWINGEVSFTVNDISISRIK